MGNVNAYSRRAGSFVEITEADEIVCAFVPPQPSIDVLALPQKLGLAERLWGGWTT